MEQTLRRKVLLSWHILIFLPTAASSILVMTVSPSTRSETPSASPASMTLSCGGSSNIFGQRETMSTFTEKAVSSPIYFASGQSVASTPGPTTISPTTGAQIFIFVSRRAYITHNALCLVS
ncbi:uncharacterized protein LOC114955840 [Acropora millepora]|uniref:uncharacterized protein LOC114955840 n=1 Tax=Acropora millepora TaxID=45264 RepID=UPI001CF4009E|nr:uncharacterized protein LOC114955840 [Acropora millepora]